MRLHRRFLLAFAAPSLAALGLAAAAGPLHAQAVEPLEKVTILLDWKALPTYAGFFLARETGAFERRGLDVSFEETQGAMTAATKIAEGKPFWIGSSSGIATAIGVSKGLPIKSLAVYYQKTPTVIFSRTEDHISHPRDLYGKTLGLVPGSITSDEFQAMIVANKLDRGKINEIRVDWAAYDLVEKKVDALIDYNEMAPTELIAEDRRITMIRLSDFGVRAYSLNLIVNNEAWTDPARHATAIAAVIVPALTRKATAWSRSGRPTPRRGSPTSSRAWPHAMSTAAWWRSRSSFPGRPSASRLAPAGKPRSRPSTRSACWPSRSPSTTWRSWGISPLPRAPPCGRRRGRHPAGWRSPARPW